MAFSSMAELKAALVAAAVGAVAEVEGKVYGTIDGNLGQFYGEFSPEEYIRTNALRNSLARTGVTTTGSGASAEVYFNTPSYQQGLMPLQHTPEHGMYGWATWDGGTVLNVAMESGVPHGGYAGGTPVWTTSMAELGDIEALLMGALQSRL